MDKGEETPALEEDRKALLEHNLDLLRKKAVEPAPRAHPGCIFKMLLVDKKDTKEKRPVVNMRPLSPYVDSPHFKMENLVVAKDLIDRGDWLSRLDLKDAYLHVPLHPQIRPRFRYRLQGKLYQWTTIPFGFKDSPRMFQKLIIEAISPLRQQGLRLVAYLDDILLISPSHSQCLKEANTLVSHLLSLGFVINLEKSELAPAQQKVFLGTLIDTQLMQFSLPKGKLQAFRKRITSMLRKARTGREATLKELQSLVGTIGAMSDCITAVRLRLNSIMEVQNLAMQAEEGRALFSPEASKDLRWWKANMAKWNGKSIIPPQVDLTLDVDASDKGLGAIFLGEDGKVQRAHRFFQEGDPTHINEREMLAAEYGLKSFTSSLRWKEKSIRVRTDNVVAMAYINKMGGRIPSLSRIAERIHSFALRHQLLVTAEWIPSEENTADKESRIEGDLSDSELNPKAFSLILRRFGELQVDLFATGDNAKTPLFVSLKADPKAWYVDAFSRPLPQGKMVYANPPFILIPRLLSKLRREGGEVVLVSPVWPSQPWWPVLMKMALTHPPPLLLPRSSELFLPPRGSLPQCPPMPPKWDTVVCRVSGRSWEGMGTTRGSTI
jgi:hypothetical protein